MKKLTVFILIIISFSSWGKNDSIDSELYYKYFESFFTFQDYIGEQFTLDEKYIAQTYCAGKIFSFKSEINHYEFFNDCSNSILDSFYEYVDSKVNYSSNKDSLEKVVIERVRMNKNFKQTFYSIYCQYYKIDTDTLFGLTMFKKDTLSIDSLENIALLSFTIDGVDSIDRYLISHFCGSAGTHLVKNASTKLIYYDLIDAIMIENVKEVYRKYIKVLNTESKARIIDGETIEEIRKKIEYRLRKEIKESGVLKEAIMVSYENKKYSPYVILN